MSWPPDPDKVREHDEKAHKEREGQKYNTPPPPKPDEDKPAKPEGG